MYKNIKVRDEGDSRYVVLNRPEIRNAFNPEMIEELYEVFNEVKDMNEIRFVVLTGEGKAFSAGADLNWMKKMAKYTFEENLKDAQMMANMYKSIYKCPKIVICAVNGPAVGGGVGLVCVCDLVISSNDAFFMFSEARIGLAPAVISPFVIRRIGYSLAKRYFLTTEKITAEDALKINMVDWIVPKDDLNEFVMKKIEELRIVAPKSASACKLLIDYAYHTDLENAEKFAVKKIAELRSSDEGGEGISSFLEKKKPPWR